MLVVLDSPGKPRAHGILSTPTPALHQNRSIHRKAGVPSLGRDLRYARPACMSFATHLCCPASRTRDCPVIKIRSSQDRERKALLPGLRVSDTYDGPICISCAGTQQQGPVLETNHWHQQSWFEVDPPGPFTSKHGGLFRCAPGTSCFSRDDETKAFRPPDLPERRLGIDSCRRMAFRPSFPPSLPPSLLVLSPSPSVSDATDEASKRRRGLSQVEDLHVRVIPGGAHTSLHFFSHKRS